MAENNAQNHMLMAMVSMVAIVGIVLMIMMASGRVSGGAMMSADSSNLAGRSYDFMEDEGGDDSSGCGPQSQGCRLAKFAYQRTCDGAVASGTESAMGECHDAIDDMYKHCGNCV